MPWPKSGGADGDKLYLEEGKVVKILLLEDECQEIYHIHYVNGKNSRCKPDGCEHCQKGLARQERGGIRVWDLADAKEKKLGLTPTFSRALQASVSLCGGRVGFAFSLLVKKESGKKVYYVQGIPSTDAPPKTTAHEVGDAQDDTTPF